MSRRETERSASTCVCVVALAVVTGPGCGGRAEDARTHAPTAGGEVSSGASSSAAGVGGASGAGGSVAGGTAGGTGGGPTSTPGFIDITRTEAEALYGKACAGSKWQIEPMPTTRLFLLQASETMRGTAKDAAQSDWDFARSAVIAAGPSLWSGEATGVGFFPNRVTMPQLGAALPSSACIDPRNDVEIAPDDPMNPAQWQAIVAALSEVAPVPGAGTPLFDAYRSAATTLAAASFPFENARLLALVGDGQPTLGFGCQGADDANAPLDPEPLIREIEQARNHLGVLTFVIGTPGSASTRAGMDARPWLSRAARAGGPTPFGCSDQGPKYCHYDMVSQPALSSDLPRALARAKTPPLGCTFSFGEPPPGMTINPALISLIYWTFDGEPKLVIRNSDDSCGVGYRIVSHGVSELEVCPETCAVMQADRGGIELDFGCSPTFPPGK